LLAWAHRAWQASVKLCPNIKRRVALTGDIHEEGSLRLKEGAVLFAKGIQSLGQYHRHERTSPYSNWAGSS
jgi:hypothetical protein